MSDRRTDLVLSVALLVVIIGAAIARWISSTVDSQWPFAVLAAVVLAILFAVTAIMARANERTFAEEATAAWRGMRRSQHQ